MIRDYLIAFAAVLVLSINSIGCSAGEPVGGVAMEPEAQFFVPGYEGTLSESEARLVAPEMFEEAPLASGDIGQSRQALFVPGGYGMECDGNGERCSPPWQNGTCCMPDKRKVPYYFDTASCTDATAIQAIKDALNVAKDILIAQGWESSFTFGTGPAPASATRFRCGDAGAGALGVFSPANGLTGWLGADIHDTANGDLIQYAQGGEVKIDVADLVPTYIWKFGTTTQRHHTVYNITLHEAMHVGGLGHTATVSTATGQKLMGFAFPVSFHSDGSNTLLYPTTAERSMLDCYNETSGTNPNC